MTKVIEVDSTKSVKELIKDLNTQYSNYEWMNCEIRYINNNIGFLELWTNTKIDKKLYEAMLSKYKFKT